MIIYTCPKCGGDLQEVMLASNPPQYQKYCSNCGWSHVESEREEICRIPYVPITSPSTPAACSGCSNHPNNGGSGICHCTLGEIASY